ncbi:MAG TPA: hypothetical protein VGE21_01250 [Flavobacteriales bacterium]
MEQAHEHDELKRIAPVLSALPKRDPFVVEEGLFDRLPHAVQARITAAAERRAFSWPKRLAIAFPVMALLSIGLWWMTRTVEPAPLAEDIITPLTDEELESMDPQEFMAMMDAGTDVQWDSVHVQLSDDEMLAYLEEQSLDLTDLINVP